MAITRAARGPGAERRAADRSPARRDAGGDSITKTVEDHCSVLGGLLKRRVFVCRKSILGGLIHSLDNFTHIIIITFLF